MHNNLISKKYIKINNYVILNFKNIKKEKKYNVYFTREMRNELNWRQKFWLYID